MELATSSPSASANAPALEPLYWEDLRSCLAELELEGELTHISRPVSVEHEIAAHIRKSCTMGGPAFLFENVDGFNGWRVLGGLYGTIDRVCRLLGGDRASIPHAFAHAMDHPLAPVIVDDGPVKEVKLSPDEIDLTTFPIVSHSEHDSGRFVTIGVEIAKDPETSVRGLGIHRMMLRDAHHLSFMGGNEKRVVRSFLKNEDRDKPQPLAVVIGPSPAVALASTARVDHGVDKLGIAGTLQGRPVELVKCETIDCEVPANAEMVIEGELLPGIREPEGPFGEFTGCYSGGTMMPVFRVTAITTRRDPLYQTALTGMPVTEDQSMMWVGRSAGLWKDAQRAHPEVKAINWNVESGNMYEVIVSIRKRMETEPWNVIASVLSGPALVKYCMVVDDDVDIFDQRQLGWVMATRVQPDRDVHIFPKMVGALLDPSSALFSQTSKMGIDATIPLTEERWRYEMVKVPGAEEVEW
jgi:2,5-furandicarboxylate decarboxylase 1